MDVLISAPQKAPYTLYPIRYTLYSTYILIPYTLYAIPYTLHPILYLYSTDTLVHHGHTCCGVGVPPPRPSPHPHARLQHTPATHACNTSVEHAPAQHTHTSPAARHRAGRARRVPAS